MDFKIIEKQIKKDNNDNPKRGCHINLPMLIWIIYEISYPKNGNFNFFNHRPI